MIASARRTTVPTTHFRAYAWPLVCCALWGIAPLACTTDPEAGSAPDLGSAPADRDASGGDASADPDAGRDAAALDAAESDSGLEVDGGVPWVDGGGDTGVVPADGGLDGGFDAAIDAGVDTGVDGGSPFDAGLDAGGPPPGLEVLSYFGGSSQVETVGDQGRDVTVDPAGNWYVTGGVDRYQGAPFNGASGHDVGNRDDEDIFVLSLDPQGNLRYATIIGGPGYDRPYAIEVDAQGRVWVAGRAGVNFPTTPGAFQTTFAGDNNPNGAYGTQDGFVLRLDTDGSVLWATYVGGGGRDFIRDIDVDLAGNIYGGVAAAAGNHPAVTTGAFITTPPSGQNTVVFKLNPSGTSMLWGGYLGGSGDETSPPSIRVNAAGEAFVLWGSGANDVPVTTGAFQTTPGGGDDLVVARISADGGSLIYCTYFGGPGDEVAETHQLGLTATDQAVLVTQTTSDLALPVGGYQNQRTGAADLLIGLLSADGTTLVAGTYLGGGQGEHAEGVVVDAQQRIVVTGASQSPNFPVTNNAFQATKGANGDGIAVVLSADLSTLDYSTFVGGNGDDGLRGVDVDATGAIIGTGQTTSTNLNTVNALQPNWGGGRSDVFFVRLLPN